MISEVLSLIFWSEVEVRVLYWFHLYVVEVLLEDTISQEYAFVLFDLLPIGFVGFLPEAAAML